MVKTGKTTMGAYFARARVNKYQQIFILGWLILGLGIALGFSSETAPGNPGANEKPDVFEQAAVKMSDNNPAVRRTGIAELVKTGNPKAVPALIKALEDSDKSVRLEAVEGLMSLKSRGAVESLAKAASEDKEPEIREAALLALGSISGEKAVPVLLEGLKDEDFAVKLSAIRLLGSLRSGEGAAGLINLLSKTDDPGIKKSAIKALGQIGSVEGIKAVLRELRKSKNTQVQVEAVKALEKMVSGLGVIAILEKKLKSPDAMVQSASALSLARLGNHKGLNVSLKLLSNKNRRVRYHAAEALGEMGEVSAVKTLEKAFEKEMDTAVKGKIRSSLGKLKALSTKRK